MKHTTQTELVNYAIDYLRENTPDCYGCDLHNEIFNSDYYIIGRYDAEQWLTNNGGIFNLIDDVKEYEEDNFGEVNTNLSEPENIVNMVVYIYGEEILSKSKTLQDNWGNRLQEEDIEAIITELENLI